MSNEDLYNKFSMLMRNAPTKEDVAGHTDENIAWLGDMSSFLGKYDNRKGREFDRLVKGLHFANGILAQESVFELFFLLSKTRSELVNSLDRPNVVVSEKGQVFTYFNRVREIIEEAIDEVLIVDQYLTPDFVSRYLTQCKQGITIKLLTAEKRNRLDTLKPALELFSKERGHNIELRAAKVHDRYIFIDKTIGYQSGASFVDGPKNAASTIIQVLDGFENILGHYETE